MSNDLILDSLQRRMRALHSLYRDAVATMDLEQVNHFEREGVLPIAFSLFHIVNMIDASFMLMTGEPPIWDDGWAARVHPAIPDHGKHRTVAEMVHQRIGDYQAFQQYMGEVFTRTEIGSTSSPRASSPGWSSPARSLPRWPPPTAPGWPARRASRCSTPPSAGSTSTACATWARSNWPVVWWAWAG